MWKRMLARLRTPSPDDEIKEAAWRETERLKAELKRLDIRIELATHRSIEELEHELRQQTAQR
jgi:hypothetical protein